MKRTSALLFVFLGVSTISARALDPVLCSAQAGATADVKINAATALVPAGGTVDCRGLTGAQTIAANVNLNSPNVKYIFADGATFTPNAANLGFIGTANGIEIECGGAGGTVFDWSGQKSDGLHPIVSFNPAGTTNISNIRIHHCTFIGDRILTMDAHSPTPCILLQSKHAPQSNIFVEDNFVQNCGGGGIGVTNYSTAYVRRNQVTQSSGIGIQWNTASTGAAELYREIEISDNILYDDNTGNVTAVGAILVGNIGTQPPAIAVQGVVVRGNVVKNDIIGGDGNGNAFLCNVTKDATATGCGPTLQINNVNFVSILDNIVENVQQECISFTASDVIVRGNRLNLCGGTKTAGLTTITTASAGGILVFMANTPNTTQNVLIDANHITDTGYGVGALLGVGVATDADVLLNVTISNNVIAKLNQGVIRGIDIDNRSLSTNCGGGTRQCNFTLTNMNILNNTVYNATLQAYSLQPVSTPSSMGGAPNLASNIGNLASAAVVANCGSSSSPASCSGAASGSVALATGGTTLVVDTTAVTAVSQIQVQFDETLGTRLGVTCNNSAASEAASYSVSTRAPGTSFTIKTSSAPITNPVCLSYSILN